MALHVIALAFFVVREHGVSFRYVFELLFGARLLVPIRMVLQSELAVNILDLFLTCVLLNTENLIIVALATQGRSLPLYLLTSLLPNTGHGDGFGPAALPVGSAALPVAPSPAKPDPAGPAASACGDDALALW